MDGVTIDRRFAVVLLYTAYALGAGLQWRADEQIAEPQRWIILGLFAVSGLAAMWLFFRSDYWRLAQKPDRLDERERAARGTVFARAYGIAAIAAIAGLAWQALAIPAAHRAVNGVDFNVLLWGYILFVTTLPSALIAWKRQPGEND